MGRSPRFRYYKIKPVEDNIPTKVIETISQLKEGDIFRIVFRVHLMYDSEIDDLYPPLTRSPSSYGYEVLPLVEDFDYVVENTNEEPGLFDATGLKSIRFAAKTNFDYYPTYRIFTDGTIRECEAFDVCFCIDEIEIIKLSE